MSFKMHVKKDDLVAVISGEDKGKQGKVLEARPRENRIVVDGVNIQKRHVRPTRTNPQGGVVERPDWRPITRYEAQGHAAGRSVTDLSYRRIARAARRLQG